MARPAKLSPNQYKELMNNPTNRSNQELAQFFGVSIATIHNYKTGRTKAYENEVQNPTEG